MARTAAPTNSVPRLMAASFTTPVCSWPPDPAPDRAATPTASAIEITNFDKITATSNSTVRRNTPRAAGHTMAAKDSGETATRT